MQTLEIDTLPDRIRTRAELQEFLSRPTPELIEDLAQLEGDILVLGAGGQIGPSLARMAKRAAPDKRVVAVSRFGRTDKRRELEDCGVETIACDLLDRDALDRLPKLPNVIYMVSKKFGHMVGTQFGEDGEQPLMWVTNTYIAALAAQVFRDSRIVAFSASAVYDLAPVTSEGCDETQPTEPTGEYANSVVGRERVLQFFSQQFGTPGRLIRLNYALSLDYSILFDTACRVRDGQPIPLKTGYANVIWQGDAVNQILRSLRHCTTPTSGLNIGGHELTSVRELGRAFGEKLGKAPIFTGEESAVDWVNSTAQARSLFGEPVVPLNRAIDWIADWVQNPKV